MPCTSGSSFAWDSIQVRVDDVDLFGPKVVAQGPSAAVAGPLSSFQVTFSEAIAPASFTAADVTIADPTGNAVAVTNITTSDNLTFTAHFAAQATPGVYSFIVGPGVTDAAGNAMNQDGDAVSGEATGDRYSGTITVTAQPVAEDDVGVDLHARLLSGPDRPQVLVLRAVLGADRALLVELTQVEEVIDRVAGVVLSA